MLQAQTEANIRFGGLSRTEWLVAFGSVFLIIAVAISLTLFYTGEVFWIFLWNWPAFAIIAVICVV